jgi:hypothetical protein
MTLAALKALLEADKNDKEVQAYLVELAKPTTEGITSYLETEDGKRLLQPRLDAFFTKGLTTWKEKSMPDVLETEIKKRFPGETPEQKQIRELQVKQAESERKAVRAELKNKALSILTTKGLPLDLVDQFIGDDEKGTVDNLAQFEKVWTEKLQAAVDVKFKENGRAPNNQGGSGGGPKDLSAAIADHYKK